MKNLEKFKRELKNRVALMVVLMVLALLAAIFSIFYLRPKFPTKDVLNGFTFGFFIGIENFCIMYMVRIGKALQNESELKKLYTEENDEREVLIRLKSGSNIVPLISSLIFIAAIPVGYISTDAFIAMGLIATIQIIISAALKHYWTKKI